MKVVLDTGILVAGLRSDRGASRKVVRAALGRRISIVVSVPLVVEYEAVLTRQEHLRASELNADEIGRFIDALVHVAEPVHLAYLWRPALRDPDDDMVLETAVNGRASAVVTHNRRDFEGVAERFGIRVMAPSELLPGLEDQ